MMEELRETETKIRKGIHLAWQSFKILHLRSVILVLSVQTGDDKHTRLNKGIETHRSSSHTWWTQAFCTSSSSFDRWLFNGTEVSISFGQQTGWFWDFNKQPWLFYLFNCIFSRNISAIKQKLDLKLFTMQRKRGLMWMTFDQRMTKYEDLLCCPLC